MSCQNADRHRALRRLNSDYARKTWLGVGYFGVPGAVLRQLADEGYADMRKRGPSSPTEFRSRTLLAGNDPAAWFPPMATDP